MALLFSGLLIIKEKITCNDDVEVNSKKRRISSSHLENSFRNEGL